MIREVIRGVSNEVIQDVNEERPQYRLDSQSQTEGQGQGQGQELTAASGQCDSRHHDHQQQHFHVKHHGGGVSWEILSSRTRGRRRDRSIRELMCS